MLNVADGNTYIYDARIERESLVFHQSFNPYRQSFDQHPTGDVFAGRSSDGIMKIWDIKTASVSMEIKRMQNIGALTFSHKGDYLFVGNDQGIIQQLEFSRIVNGDIPNPIVSLVPSKQDLARKESKIGQQLERAVASLEHVNKDLAVSIFNTEIQQSARDSRTNSR